MASFKQYTSGGGASENFSIKTFSSDEIKVYVDNVLKTATTHYNIDNYTTNGGTVTWTSGNVPNGPVVRIVRDTGVTTARATYAAGSSIKADDLNNNHTQALRSLEEQDDQLIQTYDVEDGAVTSAKIKDGTVVNADISSTAEIAVSKLADGSARQVLQTAANGSDVEWTSNVDIPGTLDVTSTAQFDSNVNITGATGVDGNFDVNTNKFTVDSSTGNTVIGGNLSVSGTASITGTSTYTGQQTVPGGALVKDIRVGLDADNEVSTTSGNLILDSANGTVQVTDNLDVVGNITVSGTVDGRDIASDGSKLDGIEASATADQTAAEIRTLVESASDSNVFTDADHSKLNAIEASATADQTASEIKTLLQSDKLTANEIATGALDGRYYTETESDARYFNISTGDTIKDGDTFPDNDTTIATTAAINDRIIDLVDDVGGFVPIANETSFPAANPDVNNGAGTLVSIKALDSNLTSNGSGVATIANGAGSGNTVTINGLANSTTYTATFGMIVETTSTLHTYTFHRLVPKATEVTTVAGSISNVNTVAGSISNVNTVAGNNSNVTTVAGVSGNVTTVAGISSNITTVAGISSDVTAVAGDATDIGAVAAKATEIGRLGTADAVADMNTLGTNAIVSDLDTCATNVSNINTTAGSIANVNTVASNMGTVNDFAARYRVGANNPTSSLDTGDLFFNTSANELKVYNGSSWQGGVTASGSFASVTGNTFTGDNLYNDSVKLKLGTGSDLQIYHDGSNSSIQNATGKLYLYGGSNQVVIKAVNAENSLTAKPNGAIELYYDDSKKFETTSDGVKLPDGQSLTLGDDNDVKIKHQSGHFELNNVTGNTYFQANGTFYLRGNHSGSVESMLVGNVGGAVELYYDNAKRLETSSSGITIPNTLTVSDGANLDGDVKFEDNGGTTDAMMWDKSESSLKLNDNTKIQLGDSQDLKIYHDGSNSYIDDLAGTGALRIRTNQLALRNNNGDENYLIANSNGQVELYYDNSKKLETTSSGVTLTGDVFFDNATNAGNDITWDMSDNLLEFTDDTGVSFGDGKDLQIYHNGTDSYIRDTGTGSLKIDTSQFLLRDGSGSDSMITATADGAVELYHNNVKTFETEGSGIKVLGPEGGSSFIYIHADQGDDNADKYHLQVDQDGTGFYIKNEVSGSTEVNLRALGNNTTELYYDNSKKLETVSAGIKVSGHYYTDDNNDIRIGTGSDMKLYHDGTNSTIYNSTNDLNIQNDGDDINLYAADDINLFAQGTESAIKCIGDGAVELYYNGVKTIETTVGGITVLAAEGNDGYINLYADEGDDNADQWRFTAYASESKMLWMNRAGGSWETNIASFGSGAVKLDYDNSTKIETTSSGVTISGNATFGDGVGTVMGASNDFQIYHDNGNASNTIDGLNHKIELLHSGEKMIVCNPDDSVELYHNNILQLETTQHGINVKDNSGAVHIELYTNGSTRRGYIYADDGDRIYLLDGQGHKCVLGVKDAHTSLYYDNSQKFYTQSYGAVIDGTLKPAANNTHDLGDNSYKFSTVWAKNTAKAWINVDGDASTASIRASHNVSSLGDDAYEQHTVNFSTNMGSASDYCFVSGARASSSGGGGRVVVGYDTPTASAFKYQMRNLGNSNEHVDAACLAFFST